MKNLKKIKDKIKKSESIALTCHINPDGDCIGSMLALGLALSSAGKDVHMVSQDEIPSNYAKLPGARRIKRRMAEAPDLAITVDCNSKEMVGKTYKTIKNSGCVIEIDHHDHRRPFGDIQLIDVDAGAVGEIIYRLLKYLKITITSDIARNILTSIIVETNSFRLPSVRPLTFAICAEMVRTGVNFKRLSELVYWAKSREAAILSGICMSKLRFEKCGKLAWSVISRKDFSRIGGKDQDVDAVANDILSIQSVKVAVLFREKRKDAVRVSIRSKGRINVASLAYSYGGGGHVDSAGCFIPKGQGAREKFIRRAKTLIKRERK